MLLVSDTPRRMEPILPGVVQAQLISARVGEPRLAPQPALVFGTMHEHNPLGLQFRCPVVETLRLKVHHRPTVNRCPWLSKMDGKTTAPVGTHKARIVRTSYDEPQSKPPIEHDRLVDVAHRNRHLIESHANLHLVPTEKESA